MWGLCRRVARLTPRLTQKSPRGCPIQGREATLSGGFHRGTAPARAICNSTKNATASVVATRLVRVTHPFHPLSGRELLCVGERYNRYGMTLLLETDDGAVCAVRPQWTDVVAPDPEIVLGGQRALFRVADLLELARLVDRLSGCDSPRR